MPNGDPDPEPGGGEDPLDGVPALNPLTVAGAGTVVPRAELSAPDAAGREETSNACEAAAPWRAGEAGRWNAMVSSAEIGWVKAVRWEPTEDVVTEDVMGVEGAADVGRLWVMEGAGAGWLGAGSFGASALGEDPFDVEVLGSGFPE